MRQEEMLYMVVLSAMYSIFIFLLIFYQMRNSCIKSEEFWTLLWNAYVSGKVRSLQLSGFSYMICIRINTCDLCKFHITKEART